MTSAAADDLTPAGALSRNLHRIVVVGGGAGGLELVTRLGDTLGRRCRADIALIEKARTHLWKPLLHEVAAGSMDVSRHELDYLAQAYWHGFRYKFGEMIGLDRARHLVHLAANLDDEGRLITPERSVGYDTLVIAIGSVSNDFGTPGVKEYAICLDTPAVLVLLMLRAIASKISGLQIETWFLAFLALLTVDLKIQNTLFHRQSARPFDVLRVANRQRRPKALELSELFRFAHLAASWHFWAVE